MAVEDITPANQSLAQGRLGHSMQRQSDMVDLYAEDARRHYLLEQGKMNQNDAVATRHIEESGSGVARQLNPFMFLPNTAVKSS